MLPAESAKWCKVFAIAAQIAESFGYKYAAVPVFEFTEVFKRTLGEETDIVSKEMYTFEDRGGESLTLRPEFTAGICRALISNGLTQSLPIKVHTCGPVFRYERPQKGRMRQFHQIDLEVFGNRHPLTDVEVINAGYEILCALGLRNKITLELNTLGDAEGRAKYRAALVEYFSQYKGDLSDDSKRRLETNPLRILDSKDEGDRKLIPSAPRLRDYISADSTEFFAQLLSGLDALSIPYKLNDRLVRGLDYYNDTVFEFTTTLLGSQNAVLGGGRYDGLVRIMGGHDVPAIGFAAGVERLVELAEIPMRAEKVIHVLPLEEAQAGFALKIARQLREDGFVVEIPPPSNASKAFKKANQQGVAVMLVLGAEEMESGMISLKNMITGEQIKVEKCDLTKHIYQL